MPSSVNESIAKLAQWPLRNPALSLATVAALVSSTGLVLQASKSTTTRGKKTTSGGSLYTSSTPISDDAVALDHLLAAFGPDGRNAKGTAPGCMVASPSKAGDGDSNNYW